MDVLTPEQRKKAMTAIKSKGTSIERILCKALWKKGYRYRKNYRKLPGCPDIVFIKKKIVVFCDSEFWHGYNYDKLEGHFDKNREFWINKIKKNMERDKAVTIELERLGWIVLRFWGKQIIKETKWCVEQIEETIKKGEAKERMLNR